MRLQLYYVSRTTTRLHRMPSGGVEPPVSPPQLRLLTPAMAEYWRLEAVFQLYLRKRTPLLWNKRLPATGALLIQQVGIGGLIIGS